MKTVVIVSILLLLLAGCGKKETKFTTFGNEYEVVVFADEQFQRKHSEILRAQLGKPVFYTHTEDVYRILERNIEEFNRYFKYKNIIFIDNIADEDPVTKFIEDALGKEQLYSVTKASIIHKEHVWFENQNVIFLLFRGDSVTPSSLRSSIRSTHEILDTYVGNRLALQIAAEKVGKKTTADVVKKFGFPIFIPRQYETYKEDEHFYGVVTRSPDRHYSISRQAFTGDISITTLIAARNNIGKKYYDGDTVATEIFEWQRKDDTVDYQCGFERLSIAGKEIFKLHGLWENTTYGGTFITYAWKENDQLYLLDAFLFYPKGNKWAYMNKLDLMLKQSLSMIFPDKK